jgi:membrane protease YdiL (CAAX protease family)
MDWLKILYPGLWCILFVIAGLQIGNVTIISGPVNPVFTIAYYGCAIAALIALCFLIIRFAKIITEEKPGRDIKNMP